MLCPGARCRVMLGACPRPPGVGNSAPVEAPDTPPTLDELSNEIRDVALQVHLAEERKDERDVVAAAHAGIERLSRRYRELLQSLSPASRCARSGARAPGRRSQAPGVAAAQGSRGQRREHARPGRGRRRTRRSPHHGRVVVDTTGAPRRRSWASAATSSRGAAAAAKRRPTASSRWSARSRSRCSVRCAGRATRTAPRPRGGRPRAPRPPPARIVPRADPEAQRRAAELRALGEEVAAAATVRDFDPKERYKAGEIIVHPEYGRGKIENVLRSSLLVRFSVGGLKSLMLQ